MHKERINNVSRLISEILGLLESTSDYANIRKKISVLFRSKKTLTCVTKEAAKPKNFRKLFNIAKPLFLKLCPNGSFYNDTKNVRLGKFINRTQHFANLIIRLRHLQQTFGSPLIGKTCFISGERYIEERKIVNLRRHGHVQLKGKRGSYWLIHKTPDDVRRHTGLKNQRVKYLSK